MAVSAALPAPALPYPLLAALCFDSIPTGLGLVLGTLMASALASPCVDVCTDYEQVSFMKKGDKNSQRPTAFTLKYLGGGSGVPPGTS